MSNVRRRGYSGNADDLNRNSKPQGFDSWDRSRYSRSRYGSSARNQEKRFSRETASHASHSSRSSHAPSSVRGSHSPYSSHASRSAGSQYKSHASNRRNSGGSANSGPFENSYANAYAKARRSNSQPTGMRSAHPDFSDAHDYSREGYSREATLKKKKRKPRKALIAVISVAVVVLLCGGAAYAYVNNISGNLHDGVDDQLRNALVQTDMANEPFYLLLLGTDGSKERDFTGELDGIYRSDSIMLARIDAPNKTATLVSIGRDTIVNLPEHGEQKINAAFGLGGPTAAVKAVSELAGVPISHYAQVDFDGFSDLVDALGGIEVDVPMEVNDLDAGGRVLAGPQTLDGVEALILCRARNTYADMVAHPDEVRAANQRLVLSAIAHKLLDADIVTIAGSVQAISRYVTTDLELSDIIGLAQALQGLDTTTGIYTGQAPTNSRYEDEIWCEYIDKAAWKAMMERVDQGLPPTEENIVDSVTGVVVASAGKEITLTDKLKNASIVVKNGTEHEGLAKTTRTKFIAQGFNNVVVGDIAQGYDYPNTLVIYQDDSHMKDAQAIATALGQGRAVKNDGSYLLTDCDYLVLIGDDWVVNQ